MGFYADSWLCEAREKIKSCRIGANVSDAANFLQLADGVERAIKAVLIENHGSVPEKYDHHELVTICQATGVWHILPPALKIFLKEIESCRLSSVREGDSAVADLPLSKQWEKHLSMAPRLVDYLEHHIIGNDSVLRRLTLT